MFVICQILSTPYPRWKALEIANMRLSVGLTSSSSMSSTKSFWNDDSQYHMAFKNKHTFAKPASWSSIALIAF
jgi:hypothetical protein